MWETKCDRNRDYLSQKLNIHPEVSTNSKEINVKTTVEIIEYNFKKIIALAKLSLLSLIMRILKYSSLLVLVLLLFEW